MHTLTIDRDTLRIEKGVPIPRKHKESKYSQTINAMDEGNSVLIKDKGMVGGFKSACNKLKVEVITRTEDEGIRVWRTSGRHK